MSDDAPEDDFGGLDLPPPPPPPAPGSSTRPVAEPPSPPPQELIDIAAKIGKSSDPLERQSLAHAACLASMADVLADTKISAAERRKEIRVIAAAAARLMPHARLYQAEQTVKQARAEVENRKRANAGAKIERGGAVAGGGQVIPIRGAAVPSDGPKS